MILKRLDKSKTHKSETAKNRAHFIPTPPTDTSNMSADSVKKYKNISPTNQLDSLVDIFQANDVIFTDVFSYLHLDELQTHLAWVL